MSRWGRTYEGYSEDPALVKELAPQPSAVSRARLCPIPSSVLACAKHFAGDGGTSYGSASTNDHGGLDQGDTQVDEATLRRIHLAGYGPAVQAGVGTIMPSYSSWNGVKVLRQQAPAHGHSQERTGLRRASSSPTTTPSTRSRPTTRRTR